MGKIILFGGGNGIYNINSAKVDPFFFRDFLNFRNSAQKGDFRGKLLVLNDPGRFDNPGYCPFGQNQVFLPGNGFGFHLAYKIHDTLLFLEPFFMV